MDLTEFLVDPANWSLGGPLLTAVGWHAAITGFALAVGVLLGVGLGALLGAFRPSRVLTRWLAWVLTGVPAFGVFVLAMIIVGPRNEVLLASLVVLIMIAVAGATAGELRRNDAAVIESARALGLSGPRIFFGYRLPLVLPKVLRIGAGIAGATVTAVAVAGILGAPGLGSVIRGGFDAGYSQVFAGAVVLIVLGWLITILAAGLARLVRGRMVGA